MTSVPKYEKFEVEIDVKKPNNTYYLNPAVSSEIKVWAEFTNGSKTVVVDAFFYTNYTRTIGDANAVRTGPPYNGDWSTTGWFYKYCLNTPTLSPQFPYEILTQSPSALPIWKIRFTPTETGTWTYVIKAQDPNGITQSSQYTFNCVPSSKKGFIRVANKKYLKFDDGTPYFPIGINIPRYDPISYMNNACGLYGPEMYGTCEYDVYLNNLSNTNINCVRIFLWTEGINIFGYDYNQDICFYKNVVWDDPTTLSTTATDNTYGINMRDAWQLDYIIDLCKSKNINVQLILFPSADLQNCYDPTKDFSWTSNPCNFNARYPTNQINNSLISSYQYTSGQFNKNTDPTCISPYDFFSNSNAIQMQKDFVRYIISRWGYSTNILSWEIINEPNFVYKINGVDCSYLPENNPGTRDHESEMLNWLSIMNSYIKSIDPNKHLTTTTPVWDGTPLTQPSGHPAPNSAIGGRIGDEMYKIVDYTDQHRYMFLSDINYPTSNGSSPSWIFDNVNACNNYSKPHNISEGGADPSLPYTHTFPPLPTELDYNRDDPHGLYFHSTIWGSGFSGSMGTANLFWTDESILPNRWEYNYFALNEYWKDVKFDQDDNVNYYKTRIDGANTGLNNYFFTKNKTEIYGWCYDKNFTTEELFTTYRLTTPASNSVNAYVQSIINNRPALSNSSPQLVFNNIYNTLTDNYTVTWYNTYTGAPIGTSDHWASGNTLIVNVPSTVLAHLNNPTNLCADVAYKIRRNCHTQDCGWNQNPMNLTAPIASKRTPIARDLISNKIFYVDTNGYLSNLYKNGTWQWGALSSNSSFKVYPNTTLLVDYLGRVYYVRDSDKKIYMATWNSMTGWTSQVISNSITVPASGSAMCFDNLGNLYFIGVQINMSVNKIFKIPLVSGNWGAPSLVYSGVRNGSDLKGNNFWGCARTELYFTGTNDKVHALRFSSSWVDQSISNTLVKSSGDVSTRFEIDNINKRIFFIGNDNKVYQITNNSCTPASWTEAVLLSTAPLCNGRNLSLDGANHIFYVGPNNNMHNFYWDNTNGWSAGPLNTCRLAAASYGSEIGYLDNSLIYVDNNGVFRYAFWENNSCPTNRFGHWGDLTEGATTSNIAVKGAILNIYPNPTSSALNLQITVNNPIEMPKLEITTLMGIKTNELTFEPIKTHFETQIDVTNLKEGVYFITLFDGQNKLITKKLIKQ